MMKTTKNILIALVAGYAFLTLAVYLLQRDLVFAPSLQRVLPHDVGLFGVEEVTLITSDQQRLFSWYGRAKPSQPTILFFHGNGGGVSSRRGKIRQLMDKGYGVFVVGYPGYGGSEGNPSEDSFIDAAKMSFSYLLDAGIEASEIVIYGASLGSAVAVQLAAKHVARALVLEAPMSSIREIAQSQYPFLPVKLLLKDPFLTVDFIGRVHFPLLIVHGTADAVIPISSGQKLFELANEPKVFHAVKDAGHNNLYDFHLVDILHTFLESPPSSR
ncbi:MAG: alpha/beta hydrolase [Gammaproteobacteria bacterium]|nr:alpha/beta hydrolase [Gammaproteobacteria bacterium]